MGGREGTGKSTAAKLQPSYHKKSKDRGGPKDMPRPGILVTCQANYTEQRGTRKEKRKKKGKRATSRKRG